MESEHRQVQPIARDALTSAAAALSAPAATHQAHLSQSVFAFGAPKSGASTGTVAHSPALLRTRTRGRLPSAAVPLQQPLHLPASLHSTAVAAMVKKKVDARIRTLLENGVKTKHRTLILIVGAWRGGDVLECGC